MAIAVPAIEPKALVAKSANVPCRSGRRFWIASRAPPPTRIRHKTRRQRCGYANTKAPQSAANARNRSTSAGSPVRGRRLSGDTVVKITTLRITGPRTAAIERNQQSIRAAHDQTGAEVARSSICGGDFEGPSRSWKPRLRSKPQELSFKEETHRLDVLPPLKLYRLRSF